MSLGQRILTIALSCFFVSHAEASVQFCSSFFSSQTVEESYFSHPDFHGFLASSFELQLTSRSAGGSQGGRWFTDHSGKFYFAKNYQGKTERVLAENLTNKIYNLMGASAPKSFLKASPSLSIQKRQKRASPDRDSLNIIVYDGCFASS